MEENIKKRLLNLEKDRNRKKKEYARIKSNPVKYEELQKKQKKKYLKRKIEKKQLSIKEMSPTSKKRQRLIWRQNKALLRQKTKINQVKVLEADYDSEEVEEDPLQIDSENKNQECDRLLRRQRYLYDKEKASMLKQIEDLRKENKNLVQSKSIQECKTQEVDMTPNTKVDTLLLDVITERKEEIKKKLLFEEVIVNELQKSFQNTPKAEKRNFLKNVDETSFRKYKLTEKFKKFTCRKQESTKIDNTGLIDKIISFYEDDMNSKMAPGKKEYITRNKERKQKRYLQNSLKNLHAEFIKQNFSISYSTFCKYRPFWVMFPQTDQRNTCMCKIHANVDLLLLALYKQNIIEEKDHHEVLTSLLCDIRAELCMEKKCEVCSKKRIQYKEFHNDKDMTFYQWTTEKKNYEKDGTDKITNITTKRKFSDCPVSVINKLEDMMVGFIAHHRNICHQYESLKQLKNTLCSNEALVHIDFSENYGLKFNEEIQAVHFGANRQQVTLHTSVIYMYDEDLGTLNTHSFCTLSECNRHDAAAVWAHLIPIIKSILARNSINTIHIISDSPSSQYRNKYIFYILTQLYTVFNTLKMVTWNYQEVGHGKGAPDGIGAVLKRTADRLVAFGRDLDTFETFVGAIKKNTNIEIAEVSPIDILTKVNALPETLTSFRGTMKVHQVIWEKNADNVALRSLCCFECAGAIKCIHGKHLGFLPNLSGDRSQSISPLLSTSMCDPSSVWQSPFSLQLTSPSALQQLSSQPQGTDDNISSNHYSLQAKENEIDHTLLSVTGNSGETQTKTKKIQILSDITLNFNCTDTSYTNIQLTEADAYATDWHKSFEHFLNNDVSEHSDKLQHPITQNQRQFPIPPNQPQSPIPQNQPQSLIPQDQAQTQFYQIPLQPPTPQNQPQSLFSPIQTQPPIIQNQSHSLIFRNQSLSPIPLKQPKSHTLPNLPQSPIPQDQPQSLFYQIPPQPPTPRNQPQSLFSPVQPQPPIIQIQPHSLISLNQSQSPLPLKEPKSTIPKCDEETINPTLGDFVKVELTYDEDKKRPVQKEFFGQIIAISDSKYTCKFLRPGNSKQQIFVFPPVDDVMDLSRSQIKAVLVPIQSKRGRFSFKL